MLHTDTAAKLLTVSDNVNEIQKEIDRVVKMLLGRLNGMDLLDIERGPKTKGKGLTFPSSTCAWRLILQENGKPEVFCMALNGRVIYSMMQPGEFPEYLDTVRAALDEFIKGMSEQFENVERFVRQYLSMA